MLKKAFMFLLTVGLMMNLATFGEAKTEQTDNILSRIDEVNKDLDTVLEENDSVVLRHYDQQNDIEHIVYCSKDGVYIETSSLGDALVDRGEEICGRDSEEETDYYKVICVTDSDYEAYKSETEFVVWYSSDMLELPSTVTEEGDQIIVTLTEELEDEDKAELAEEYGVEVVDIQELEYRFEVSPDTLLINRIVETLNCGDTGLLLYDIDAQYGVDDPGNPEGMDEFINTADVRTLTLTKDPGADEETSSYTIRKGCAFKLVYTEYGLYSDEACTAPYEGASDLTADIELYLKKN